MVVYKLFKSYIHTYTIKSLNYIDNDLELWEERCHLMQSKYNQREQRWWQEKYWDWQKRGQVSVHNTDRFQYNRLPAIFSANLRHVLLSKIAHTRL